MHLLKPSWGCNRFPIASLSWWQVQPSKPPVLMADLTLQRSGSAYGGPSSHQAVRVSPNMTSPHARTPDQPCRCLLLAALVSGKGSGKGEEGRTPRHRGLGGNRVGGARDG